MFKVNNKNTRTTSLTDFYMIGSSVIEEVTESENFGFSISVLVKVISWIKNCKVFDGVFAVFIKKHNKILVGFSQVLYIVVYFSITPVLNC